MNYSYINSAGAWYLSPTLVVVRDKETNLWHIEFYWLTRGVGAQIDWSAKPSPVFDLFLWAFFFFSMWRMFAALAK